MAATFRHCVPGPRFPPTNPRHVPEARESVQFDPALHLALEDPRFLKMLDGREARFNMEEEEEEEAFHVKNGKNNGKNNGENGKNNGRNGGGLAYSAPFRLLSDEGVRALRSVLLANEQFSTMVPGRIPKCIRGIGYRSKFMWDLGFSPRILAHLSRCAGEPITPHGMCSNLSQINFGEIGAGVKVDQWHLDSVPYVMVLLMSDATDMVGGELQVARIPGDPRRALRAVQADKVEAQFIDTVKYPGPGYAIFMQGSRIAHGVTPVLSAREKRLTVVNSYQSCNPFAPPRTVYRTFKTMPPGEGEEMAHFEFARHVAWRVSGQMDYLLKKADFFGKDKKVALAGLLSRAAEELNRARGLILGETEEELPYKLDDQKLETVKQAADSLPSRAKL